MMLRPRPSRAGVITALVAAGLLVASAPVAAQRPSRAAAVAAIDSMARAAVASGQTAGLAVAVVQGDDTLLLRGYGRADLENDVPLTARGVFEIASITKEFTAAAVLKLAERGALDLDDDVARYLPGAPTAGRAVTIRQLLGHTAGVPDAVEMPGFGRLATRDVPVDSIIELIRGEPPYFPAGEQMRYSNTGFLLLGEVIEKVSGQPYAKFVEDELFAPAGMTDSRYCDPRALIPHRVRGYDYTPDGLVPTGHIDMRIPFAAGGLCSTAGDLVSWSRALADGRVLDARSLAEMTEPQTLSGGRHTRYGLGLGLGTIGGRRAWQHGGDIQGFTSLLARFPDDDLSVVVLINTQGPIRPDPLVARIADAVLGPAPAPPAPGRAPDLRRFTGHFGDDVVVEVAGGHLRLLRGPLPPGELRWVGGTTFTDGRSRYTFDPASGRAAAVWADLVVSLVRWDRTDPAP